MASIYYRGKAPAGCWWIQFYHPRTGELSRFSLATGDRYAAEVIQRRVEHEVELRRPELQLVEIPPPLTECLELASKTAPTAPFIIPSPGTMPQHPSSQANRLTVREFLSL